MRDALRSDVISRAELVDLPRANIQPNDA